MAATYDLSTSVGKVRLKIGDTDTSNPIFQDAELEYFLTEQGGQIVPAAVAALTAILVNRAYLAKRMKIGSYETEQHAIADVKSAIELLSATGGFIESQIEVTEQRLDATNPHWLPDEEDLIT